jgi:hypothetical protein
MGSGRRFVTFAFAALSLPAAALAQTTPRTTPLTPLQTPPAGGPSQSLTITPQAREHRAPALSEADRRALDLFSAQPTLTPSRGLPIGRAYGPHDEDCVRAGADVFCRQ